MNSLGRFVPQSTLHISSIALLLLGAAVTSYGQGLIYLDASDDPASNTEGTPTNLFGGGLEVGDEDRFNDNGLWDWEPAFGSAGSIYTAGDNMNTEGTSETDDLEDAPEIGITVPGLNPGTTYDIYVVYWSSISSDWGIRAGLSSNPAGNQLFNRTGISPLDGQSAVAGTFAKSALWSTPPFLAPDSEPGDPFENLDQRMYLGLIGSKMPDGSGDLDVYIDDISRADVQAQDNMSSNDDRSWFDGIAYIETGTATVLTATIDRDTGTLSINNDTAGQAVSVVSYSVTSATGALSPSEWTSIGSGSNPIDQTHPWTVNEPSMPFPSATSELSESEDGPVDGATIAANGGSFDLGDVWIRTPFEDVRVDLALDGGAVISVFPTFVNGLNDEPAIQGDFDFDGDLDGDDYGHMMGNMFAANIGVTVAEAYTFGDLNGDLTIDFADHREFQALFDAEMGPGAFSAMVRTIPEPGTLMLAGVLPAIVLTRRRIVLSFTPN